MTDQAPVTTPPFTVSVVENTEPGGRLCKVFHYDEQQGQIVDRTDAYLYEGRIRSVEVASIGEFMALRAKLKSHQALAMGRPCYPDARVVTQAALARIPPDVRTKQRLIARDRSHVAWPDGPALAMLDLDRPDQFPPEIGTRVPTTPDGWRQLLIECIPRLADVQVAWVVSSSSYVYRGDQEVNGLRGQRLYIVIASGVHIPRFAQVLHDALVLRGLVWFTVSKSGSLLKRTPFDLSVFRPEHLDFAAGPECVPPLQWRPPAPIVWNDGGATLVGDDLPLTTEEDGRRIESLLRDARRLKWDEARAQRELWAQRRGEEIAARHRINPAQARGVAEAAVQRGVLLPEFLLTDERGATVSVGELLQEPETHHGRRFHDPLEPDYRGDRRIAVFLVGGERNARVYSHAHGGQWWVCRKSIPRVVVGQTHRTVDQLREALEVDDCGIYRNGDALCWVSEEDARMVPLEQDGLTLKLQRRIEVLGFNKDGDLVPKDLPPRAVKALISEASVLPLPKLNAVVRGPFALADGSIVDTPGYDPASQVMYVPESPYPPRVRQRVSIPEANEALRRLWYPFSRFPFKSDVDRGNVLSGLLAAAVRPSIAIAPSYCITAHAAGTGKTLLAQAIGLLHTGHPTATAAMPRDDDEVRKHVFASVRQGAQYLLYDNAERGSVIESPVLANMITSERIEGRVLGVSHVEHRPNRLTFALTGNNLTLHGDLNRRILTIRLDAETETPWRREFPFHPVSYVSAHWLELRIAVLELIRAWKLHGAPRAPGASGFPEWDAIVRSVVVWASEKLDIGVGFADPVEGLVAAYAEDPETDVLGNFLEAWYGVFRDRVVQLKDVRDVVCPSDFSDRPVEGSSEEKSGPELAKLSFRDAYQAVLESVGAGYSNGQIRLGMYLAQHEGHIVGGLKFVKSGTRGGARKWRVVRVSDGAASAVDPAEPKLEDLL